jgi:hypothetical protein
MAASLEAALVVSEEKRIVRTRRPCAVLKPLRSTTPRHPPPGGLGIAPVRHAQVSKKTYYRGKQTNYRANRPTLGPGQRTFDRRILVLYDLEQHVSNMLATR